MITVNAPLIYVVDQGDSVTDYAQHNLIDRRDTPIFCHIENGAELLIRLTHCLDGRLPDLILLATNTPIMNGYEVLQVLKKDSVFRSIPILMLVDTTHERVIKRCFELGCNGLIQKAKNYSNLVNAARMLSYSN
ncbi:response regulator [Spirosoma rhododendri]|uniref:Response regulator n=1 Tax=Spirosoma rhododendri TaxID=2728024 RepID=A0A7L5DK82_9BACT|nr:response regulator [Spirosoma rhododendri]QJD77901.1 response regulator [Spirosoma rhododendri]